MDIQIGYELGTVVARFRGAVGRPRTPLTAFRAALADATIEFDVCYRATLW
jgi:pyruvoyl-dependent arginine decarboxylase (PvlArgDC)